MGLKSPFRYPGGKSRLMKKILPSMPQSETFTDLFVGGGSVFLGYLEKYAPASLVLNDKDPRIASFWHVVASGEGLDTLLECVVSTKPDLEVFRRVRAQTSTEHTDLAFQALFLNRTTFSGILDAGPIGGWSQRSRYTVDCRYNSRKLYDTLLEIHNVLTMVKEVDVYCADYAHVPLKGLVYLDPPYVAKGGSLYTQSIQPEKFLSWADSLSVPWVLSIDSHPLVHRVLGAYSALDLETGYSISGTRRQGWRQSNELLILGCQ